MTRIISPFDFMFGLRNRAEEHNLDITVSLDRDKGWAIYYSANKEHIEAFTALLFLEGIGTEEAPIYYANVFRYRAWPTA